MSISGVEVKSVDGFQGGEKDCILISLVRSNFEREVGFLKEKVRRKEGRQRDNTILIYTF